MHSAVEMSNNAGLLQRPSRFSTDSRKWLWAEAPQPNSPVTLDTTSRGAEWCTWFGATRTTTSWRWRTPGGTWRQSARPSTAGWGWDAWWRRSWSWTWRTTAGFSAGLSVRAETRPWDISSPSPSKVQNKRRRSFNYRCSPTLQVQ